MPRNERGVLSFSSHTWIRCTWCAMHGEDKQGFDLYRFTACDHAVGRACVGQEHIKYIFCTERHRMYFAHSHKKMGQLPAGFKNIL